MNNFRFIWNGALIFNTFGTLTDTHSNWKYYVINYTKRTHKNLGRLLKEISFGKDISIDDCMIWDWEEQTEWYI